MRERRKITIARIALLNFGQFNNDQRSSLVYKHIKRQAKVRMSQKRWNIAVSSEIDKALRVFLAQNDGRKGDLSKFVEEAVRAVNAGTKPHQSGGVG